MLMERYDLAVIGGGPAGYVPAIRAAQMGKKVLVFEEDELGGTCLNRGCIPTKTLVAATDLLRKAASSGKFGLEGRLGFRWQALSKRKNAVVTRLRKGIRSRFEQLGITLLPVHAEIEEPGGIIAGNERVAADNILLSPGSRPFLPGPLAVEGVDTSKEVLSWEVLPASLIIVGGGVIGCEFASIFSRLGVDVTIIEMLPSILPGIDRDVRQVVEKSFRRSGITIMAGVGASGVDFADGKVSVALDGGKVLEAERILAAVGRRPRLADLGLDRAGVEYDEKGIVTDDVQMTNLPGVYAAGDATGKWQLAHAGSAQALAAVDHMFGEGKRRVHPDRMPGCIFTSPEIAVVGPGEEEWRKRGVDVEVGVSRFIANGKAVGMNETEGFVKLIARRSDGVLVGVQMVGPDAGSLVGEAVIAVNLGVKASDIGGMIHPHPTLSELFMEAGETFGHGAIHG